MTALAGRTGVGRHGDIAALTSVARAAATPTSARLRGKTSRGHRPARSEGGGTCRSRSGRTATSSRSGAGRRSGRAEAVQDFRIALADVELAGTAEAGESCQEGVGDLHG